MKRFYPLLCLLFLLILPLRAAFPDENAEKPEPYGKEEFPLWLQDIRRAEIIAVGVFPFALFLSSTSYDTYRYIQYNFDSQYTPGPFNPARPALTEEEITGILVSSAFISLVTALVDNIILQTERQQRKE